MALRRILCYPDPKLRTIAKPVTEVNEEIRCLVDDMFETMYDHNGVGLAATQIDVHQRVITIDVTDNRSEPITLINPEITWLGELQEGLEGCLSFPGVFDKILRAEQIRFKAQDRNGAWYEREAEGLLAVCVQHELDHLAGKLMVDYLSPLKKSRVLKKMQKMHRINL